MAAAQCKVRSQPEADPTAAPEGSCVELFRLTAEEIAEAAHGPDAAEIAAHFGYKTVCEWRSAWLNKPGQIERLAFLPEFLRFLGLDKRCRITFDYDPDYPRMLLQAMVINADR